MFARNLATSHVGNISCTSRMSARRISDKHGAIPQNPHFLQFERSDGDPRTWPTNTAQVIDREGHVNFMRPLGLDHPATIRWRIGVAQGLATALKLPGESRRSYLLEIWT